MKKAAMSKRVSEKVKRIDENSAPEPDGNLPWASAPPDPRTSLEITKEVQANRMPRTSNEKADRYAKVAR